MSTKFNKQVAIITGAGTGIGFEIARQLAGAGASLVLNDLDLELAESAIARIKAEGYPNCIARAGDAGEMETIEDLVDLAVNQFGQLDLLIANAGITLFGDFFEFSPSDFRKVMELNLQGSFFLTQAAARQMRRQGTGGSILLMSSTIGQRAYPYLTAYAMTKAALSMMARSLVLELSPYHITINAIAPGATLTERTALEDPDYDQTWSSLVPTGRVGLPEDIAATALFLLSKEARQITGQTIVVDGGWTGVSRNPEVYVTRHSNKIDD